MCRLLIFAQHMEKAIIGTDIAHAAALLQQGELVAIPTETVYGLAGNGLDPEAIAKIYAAKGRPSHNPLILHIAGIDQVEKLASEFPLAAQKLAERFWPGPLTLVLPRKPHIPNAATGGLVSVGLRVPAHPLTLELLKSLDFPLAAPSANQSNRISPVTAQHVYDQLADRIPYILDGGQCQKGIESTIVSFAGVVPRLLRLGSVSEESIREIVPNLEVGVESEEILAPGMMKKHYSPKTELILPDSPFSMVASNMIKVGLICFNGSDRDVSNFDYVWDLSPTGDLEEAAHRLYAVMHEMDAMGLAFVLVDYLPETGIGKSINDRFRRAAAK